ncbi:MAG: cytochrome c oxidase subunit [Bryobacterales bacterium]|nr:cytochrome c oxidase subunit [Bryobacterales bacterium]
MSERLDAPANLSLFETASLSVERQYLTGLRIRSQSDPGVRATQAELYGGVAGTGQVVCDYVPELALRTSIFSTDHRIIARQYFYLSLIAVLFGVVLSILMRFHLVYPQAQVKWFAWLWPVKASGGVMTPELYLSLMTLHGTLMVFFVLTLAPLNAFGNLVMPEQLRAEGMAFPRLNMLSFWTTVVSFLLLIASFTCQDGGPLSGWTAYPPLSALGPIAGPGQGLGQTLWFFSIGVFCIAATLTSINFIATVIELREPDMGMMQMPLPCWNWFVTAILSLLSFPVLFAAGLLILLDRLAGTAFFLPGAGGSPLLWQHLFWFFGHPEVYIAILPGMGTVSHVISTYSGRPIFGYRAMVYATIAIAFLGMLVWGHHMFVSGLSPYSAIAFSVLTMAIGAPSAVKTFNWIATLWGRQLQLPTAMLFSLGFISIFVTGGLSGLFLGQPQIDAYFHDTYFVVAHFHLIMGVASLFGIFAGTFYWFPLMFGRNLNERLGKLHFYLTFVFAYTTFLPMHFAGFAGNPRRYADFTTFDFLVPVMPLQKWITHSAFTLAAVQLIFIWNLAWSILRNDHRD